jgi:hypothetical protein
VPSRRGALICCAVAAGAIGGCTRTPHPVAVREDGGVAVARPSGLLQVPTGWSVVTGGDGTLRVSESPGHVVLRAEIRSGVGMPTPETLRSGFTEGLRRWRVRRTQAIDEPGFVAVRLVVAEPADGGPDQEVFLSATALGTDTLLCASLRGASPATLDAIERICRGAAEPAGGG